MCAQRSNDVDSLLKNEVTSQQSASPSDDELSWTGLFALVGIINVAMLLVTWLLDFVSRS